MRIVNATGAAGLTALLVLILVTSGGCSEREKPAIQIENLTMKALPPGRSMTSAYMTLRNLSERQQTLNYIHSPAAEHIEIHRTSYSEGVMQMRPVKRLNLSPGELLVLEPGGYHLMIHGVHEALEVGDSVDITFEFQSGVVLTLPAKVRPPG